MVRLELPHVNILTKMDICPDRAAVMELLIPDRHALLPRLAAGTAPRFARLNAAVAGLLDEYSLVSFVPLDVNDDESIGEVLHHIDAALQYGEDAEVRVRDFDGEENGDGEHGGSGSGGGSDAGD
jgi:hypothetical protein